MTEDSVVETCLKRRYFELLEYEVKRTADRKRPDPALAEEADYLEKAIKRLTKPDKLDKRSLWQRLVDGE